MAVKNVLKYGFSCFSCGFVYVLLHQIKSGRMIQFLYCLINKNFPVK